MEPISSIVSTNFIERELIKRKNLNIIWSTDFYIKIGISQKDLNKFATKISDEARKTDLFPLYVLLNIQYDSKDNKHSELIIITKHGENYNIGFFDSNGPLSEIFKPDINIRNILEKLSENLSSRYYEFMEGKKSINIIGKGNCDAFCLWFIYINSESKNKTDICDKFKEFTKDIKTENVKDVIVHFNKEITRLSNKR